MKSLEDFGKVIKVVTELTELTDQDILGKSRIAEVVDARWIVIRLMRDKGYSTRQISCLLCHPERTINHALSALEDRVKYAHNDIGNILATARQQLL